MAALLTAATVTFACPPAALAAATVSPPRVGDEDAAPDAATAEAVADTYDHPVVIESETTAQTETSALPDGTRQMEISNVPVRAEDGGDWVDIDTTLTRDGAWFVPNASATPVRFGPGGSNLLDQVQTADGVWVTEIWPFGVLPNPTLSGSTATYAEALPGVDIKLTATDVGMSSVFVVKTAAAVASGVLDELGATVKGATLSEQASGMLTAAPSTGRPLLGAEPMWWDASDGGTFLAPGGDNPKLPVDSTLTSNRLSIDVEQTITDTPVTYPLFIDPEWTPSPPTSWYTDKAYPNTSYLGTSTGSDIAVGDYSPNNNHSSMFFQFPLSPMAGKVIISAALSTTQTRIAACPTHEITMYTYGPKTAGFTWNQEQSYTSQWTTPMQSKAPGSCSNADADVVVGWDVTAGVKAKLGASIIQFGLKSAVDYSRRWFKRAATLTVQYDTAPGTPSALSVNTPVRGCGTKESPVSLSDKFPFVLSANAPDVDIDAPGNKVNVSFMIMDVDQAGAATPTLIKSLNTGDQTPGTVTQQFPAGFLVNGNEYAWRAIAGDRVALSGYSSYCYFVDDETPPSLPTVTTDATSFQVGAPFQATVSSTDPSVYMYQYWWTVSGSQGTSAPITMMSTTPCPSAAGGSRYACGSTATLTVAPIDANSTLWVAAYDESGNVSVSSDNLVQGQPTNITAAADPAFNYTTGHLWSTAGLASGATTIKDANKTSGAGANNVDDLTLASTTTIDTGTYSPVFQPSLLYSGTQTAASKTAHLAVDTTQSFTVSAWLRPTNPSTTTTATAVAQAGATNPGFTLGLHGTQWAFCVQQQTPVGPQTCALSNTPPAALTWAHVTGIWDSANQQIRILITGISPSGFAPRAPVTGDTPATGSIVIGSSLTGTAVTQPWNGNIADAAIFPGVIDNAFLTKLIQRLSQN